MKKYILFTVFIIVLQFSLIAQTKTESKVIKKEQTSEALTMQNESDQLVILWTSGDPDVAIKMVFMYAKGSMKNDWWKSINLIIWGPSSKLTSENEQIQNEIKEMQKLGIVVEACKACADQYGVADKLEDLGIDVKYMGEPLTDFIKSDAKVVTF
ncbi:MAG: DsrE family protein [Melioribacteraceae bacterium]|nr:DsrE family protein [Melioribacteraceae bacterium]